MPENEVPPIPPEDGAGADPKASTLQTDLRQIADQQQAQGVAPLASESVLNLAKGMKPGDPELIPYAHHTKDPEEQKRRSALSRSFRLNQRLERLKDQGRVGVLTEGTERPDTSGRIRNSELDAEAVRLAGGRAKEVRETIANTRYGVRHENSMRDLELDALARGEGETTDYTVKFDRLMAQFKESIAKARREAIGLFMRDPERFKGMPTDRFLEQYREYSKDGQVLDTLKAGSDIISKEGQRLSELDPTKIQGPKEVEDVSIDAMLSVTRYIGNIIDVGDEEQLEGTLAHVRELFGELSPIPLGRPDSSALQGEFVKKVQADPQWATEFVKLYLLGDIDKPQRQQFVEFIQRFQSFKESVAADIAQLEQEFTQKWSPEVPEDQLAEAAGIEIPQPVTEEDKKAFEAGLLY